MAALINGIIPPQSFEVIHDRLGEILAVELENQAMISGDYDMEMPIYKERDIPYSSGELPAMNIMLEKGEYSNQHQGQSDGTYRYVIEVTNEGKSVGATGVGTLGDTIAMNKCQKVLGKVRAILEDPKYKYLGFTPPFIMNRHVENIYFGKPVKQDARHVVVGRITFVVRAPEYNALIEPNLIKGSDTNVKLYLTDKGYIWKTDQDTP